MAALSAGTIASLSASSFSERLGIFSKFELYAVGEFNFISTTFT